MTVPAILPEDLSQLSDAFPDLCFDDDERRAVLLENRSRDIQAVPGSGKTTLLAAKLYLLGQKWVAPNRGVCVISHTNVAGEEIARRLASTSVGASLLTYPHFLGTIHAFVNQFLALPYLRSHGKIVEVIDNDIFAARALAKLKFQPTLNAWVQKNLHQGPSAIASLHYRGPELQLAWNSGKLPGEGSPSHAEARQLKKELSNAGVFRHEDMFALAASLLKQVPGLSERVSWRYPLVLLDEMQDTCSMQESLLGQMFDETVVVQRYGDANQRIFVSSDPDSRLTFPRADSLQISLTKRFPETIAVPVRAVQEAGAPVAANGAGLGIAPVLILYETEAAPQVIEHFGRLVLERVPYELLKTEAVKALCTRKQGDSVQVAGRHLGDYWATYHDGRATGGAGEERVFRLLSDDRCVSVCPVSLHTRVRDVKRALLLCLRVLRCPTVNAVRDSASLFRCIESAGVDSGAIRALCRELALSRDLVRDQSSWQRTVGLLFTTLSQSFTVARSFEEFCASEELAYPQGEMAVCQNSNECVVTNGDKIVRIQISTVALAKGETHVATLVLESYGGTSRKFDLQNALPGIAGDKKYKKPSTGLLKSQYRNLYVAMSRPRHFLCLAMNSTRASAETVEALQRQGWEVSRLG